MQDINDPKIQKEMEAQQKAFFDSVMVLRELPEFKTYLDRLETMAEYTKDKLTKTKSYDDIKVLQTYYQFINDLLILAYAEEPNKQPDTK